MRAIETTDGVLGVTMWPDFCEQKGMRLWGMNADVNSDREFTLTAEQARELGIISRM